MGTKKTIKIESYQDAIFYSLPDSDAEDALKQAIFLFERALKGVIGFGGEEALLQGKQMELCEQWRQAAEKRLLKPLDPSFIQTSFFAALGLARSPIVGDLLAEAFRRADEKLPNPPKCVEGFLDPNLKRLAMACFELQVISPWPDRFHLSCRKAAVQLGFKDHHKAHQLITALYGAHFLEVVSKGTPGVIRGGKASEFRLGPVALAEE
jgi:hypothetical protein